MEIIAGLGVRAKTALEEEASEFVIRESSNGNETLSLIHVDDLIQVATSKRDELGNVTIEKHMITKNIETFSHYRYDWLDNYKIFWWIITGIGFLTVLFSSFLSPLVFLLNIGILLFFIGLFLTVMQIADPEYIVFETSSGAHRFLVYRIGSNRPLTNISMDLIDDIMQNYLKTGKLDTSTFDERLLFSINKPSEPSNASSPTTTISSPLITAPTSLPPTAAPTSSPPTAAPTSLPPTTAPTSPPPTVAPTSPPPTVAPTSPPPMAAPTSPPPTVAPTSPPPMAAPTSPPPMAAPTSPPPATPPMRPDPIHPPPIPTGPPLVSPPLTNPLTTNSDFSEIPPPPPVDFSDIPPPPQVTDLESVSEEDKNQLLDELK